MNKRDLLVRIDSEFQDKGFKSAEASARAMVRELDRQEREVRQLANLQMAAQRENEQRQAAQLMGLEKVGKSITAVGLIAAAGMGLAAKSAADWETAWTGVTKTVNGSVEEMAALEGQLRSLAKTLPATHEEIAGVAEAAGQLGIQRQNIAAFTKVMIDLGVSTNLSAEEAATGIAQISNVMGTITRDGIDGVSKFGATLVALGNAGASTEADILDMAKRLAGAGKLVGASESDVLALANAMASMGIEAELGGGAIQRTFLKIYAATRSGGEALDGFAKVAGMTAQQFSQQWAADPIRTFDAFIKGLDKIDQSGGNAVKTLGDVGIEGTQNLQVLLRLKGAGDLLTESIDLGNRAWDENIALLAEANKRYETAASRIAIARNKLNDAAIDIGGTVLPAIAAAADRVGWLAEVFQSLPGPVREAVSVLGGAVATIGTVGGLALLAIPKLAAMNATLAATGPAGAAAAAGLRAATSALAGPWGVALVAATAAIGIYANSQYEAQKRVKELTATLDAQTGAVTANSRQWAISTLADTGQLENAKALGVNLSMVTDAALGNIPAAKALNEQLDAMLSRQRDLVNTGQANAGTYDDLMGRATRLRQVIGGQNSDLEKARTQWELTSEAMGNTGEAADGATGPTGELGTQLTDAGDAAATARGEIDKLTKAVLDYGDTLAEQRDANRAFEGAVDTAQESLKKYREELVKHARDKGKSKDDAEKWADAQIKAGKALDITTEAGRKNQETLDAIAEKAKAAAVANFENGDSVEKVGRRMKDARAEFVDMATKMGMSSTKANKLADDLGLTQQNVEQLSQAVEEVPTAHTTKFNVQTEAAIEQVRAFLRALAKIPKSSTVRYAFEGTLPNGGRSTQGGSTFGSGGYTGDLGRTTVAGEVHGQEFVSDADVTAKWRGLLEHMHAGGDPRDYFPQQPIVVPVAAAAQSDPSQSWDYSTKVMGPVTVVAPDADRFGRSMRDKAYNASRSTS